MPKTKLYSVFIVLVQTKLFFEDKITVKFSEFPGV